MHELIVHNKIIQNNLAVIRIPISCRQRNSHKLDDHKQFPKVFLYKPCERFNLPLLNHVLRNSHTVCVLMNCPK